MSETELRTVDIKPWIDRARRDPLAYVERQATEVVLTAVGSLPGYGSHIFLKGGILMAVVDERFAWHCRRRFYDGPPAVTSSCLGSCARRSTTPCRVRRHGSVILIWLMGFRRVKTTSAIALQPSDNDLPVRLT